MACPEFEDLVREGPAGHAARCEQCHALLEALTDVDAVFEAGFAGISAPPGLAAAVHTRIAARPVARIPIRRPSLIPELLDFVGWAAVLALAAIMLPHLLLTLAAAG